MLAHKILPNIWGTSSKREMAYRFANASCHFIKLDRGPDIVDQMIFANLEKVVYSSPQLPQVSRKFLRKYVRISSHHLIMYLDTLKIGQLLDRAKPRIPWNRFQGNMKPVGPLGVRKQCVYNDIGNVASIAGVPRTSRCDAREVEVRNGPFQAVITAYIVMQMSSLQEHPPSINRTHLRATA